MRLAGLAIVVSLACVMQPAHAREMGREASADTAARVFWKFAKCAVERRADSSRELLDSYTDDKAGWDAADAFAQKHARCLVPGDKLTMDENLFIGALAGAYFTKKYKDRALPDYSGLPPLIDGPMLEQQMDGRSVQHQLLLIFGDCVFGNRSDEVRQLLSTRPASDEEGKAFDAIVPILGDCLPVQEGTQLKFSRIHLRSILGEAAYKVDSKLPTPAVAAREVTN